MSSSNNVKAIAEQAVQVRGMNPWLPPIHLLAMRRRSRIARLLAVNSVVVIVVVGFAVFVSRPPSSAQHSLISNESIATMPLDTVSSTDIARNIARLTNLPEATAVSNQADSADISLTVPVDSGLAAKQTIMSTKFKTRNDIQKYTVKPGDTVASLAAKFNVTSDSIRWSNSLYNDTLSTGQSILIPPVNGIVYTVKAGDTPDSLAQKFQASKDKIVAFNDAEITGLSAGESIVIPDGTLVTGDAAFLGGTNYGFAWGGGSPVYNGNGYDFGQCTYWVALRRQQIGTPVPSNLGNAITWVQLAQRAGLSIGSTPRKGAVIWTPPSMMSGYYAAYGHVGFVEDVLPDGTAEVSDMNVAGWDKISHRTLAPAQANAYTYIY